MHVTIKVGPIKSRIIETLDLKNSHALRHALSYENRDAFMQRRAGNKHAPDRYYLITDKRQEFRTGLLHRVKQNLDLLGISYTLDDERVFGEPDFALLLNSKMTFRDYQNDAIRAAITERNGMIRMATGGGKTAVMAGIIAELERKTVVLVHRVDLMKQTLDVLRGLLAYPEIVGQVGAGVYEPNLITVCTVQTICYALGLRMDIDESDDEDLKGSRLHEAEIRQMLDEAKVVILDEAHHAPAKMISEVLMLTAHASWTIGLSATDFRDDGSDLLIEAAIGPRIHDTSISDLVDLGFLVPAKVRMFPMKVPSNPCFSSNWQTLYKHYYVDNDAFHTQVTEDVAGLYELGRHTLVLVSRIEHGHKLAKRFKDRGIDAVFLSGNDVHSRRESVLNSVRSGKLRCLIGTSIADEGLDLPILDALVLAGGGTSRVATYQRIGRTLRPFDGKENALVIDYRCRDTPKMSEKAGSRAQIYRTEKQFDFVEVRK